MSYINDPREMSIRPESGVTLENDNRIETMYHWGAMITDLCDLPVSEYMKPMTVIVLGNGGEWPNPDTGSTSTKVENVSIWLTILKNGVEVSNENILGAPEDTSDVIWTARWQWTGSFPNTIKVAAVIVTDKGQYDVSMILQDNEEKMAETEIVEASNDGSEILESFKSYGVGSVDTPSESVISPTYKEKIEDTEYKYEISTDETIIYLTLKAILNGTNVYTNTTMKFKQPIDLSNIETSKEGFNFIGWFDADGKEYKNGDLMPAKNITLTGKYETLKCNVDFIFVYKKGGEETREIISSTTVNYGSKVTKFPATSKEGFVFEGWTPSTGTTIKNDTEFIATFIAKEFKITWSGYSDGTREEVRYYGDIIEEPQEVPYKEGYTFNGWDKTFPITVKSNIKISAKFVINKYNLDYFIVIDGNDGNSLSSTSLTYGYTLPSKSKPVEKGYTFTDWVKYNAETNEIYNGKTMPAFDLKVRSERTPNVYVLAYYDNNILIKEDEYYYGETIIPYTYSKEGWNIVEYWDNLPETMPYNNISAHCRTEIMSVNVTFKDMNGNIISTCIANYGTLIKDLVPYVEGKTYIISEEILNGTVKAEDMVIYGDLIVNNYIVTFKINDNIVEKIELPFGSSIDEYVTSNYMPEEGHQMSYEPSNVTVPSNNDLVVVITYNINKWLLTYETFNGNENDIMGEIELEYGSTILDKLPETEVEGYQFTGWFIDDNKVTEETKMPNNDVYIYGNYVINTYTVLVSDGNTIILEKEYNYGTQLKDVISDDLVVNYLTELSAVGYTGILELNDNEIDLEAIINDNIEIKVKRVPNEYVLTFKNGEDIITSTVVAFGSIITYPEMNEYNENGIDYIFVWSDESYDGKTMPAFDLTITGEYQEKMVAPIYFGSFKVSKSAYTINDIAQYFNAEDAENNNIYTTATIPSCLGEGIDIEISIPIDEEMKAIYAESAVQGKKYQKLYYRPLTYVIPAEVDSEYLIELKDAIGTNITSTLVTDKQKFEFKGNEYVMYVYQTDVTCIDIKLQVYKQHFRLIKKHNVIINDGDTQVLNKAYEEGTELSVAINDDLVVNYLSELNENGYKGVIQKDGKEINVKEKIVNDIILEIKRIPNEYKLTFMNGDNIISEEMVAFKSDIIYPTMESYTENGVEYYFRWEDESYNGKTMPNMDLIIKGKYVAKLEPVVYFGSFKVAKSAYTQNDLIQYFDIKDIENTAVYNYISTGSCVDGGIDIEISVPIDEEMKTIYDESKVKGKKYQKLYYRPLAYLIPADINNEYSIELKDAIGTNISATLVTDNKIITYNDVNYVMYVYQTDVTCIDIKDQVYKQHFTLIKK